MINTSSSPSGGTAVEESKGVGAGVLTVSSFISSSVSFLTIFSLATRGFFLVVLLRFLRGAMEVFEVLCITVIRKSELINVIMIASCKGL